MSPLKIRRRRRQSEVARLKAIVAQQSQDLIDARARASEYLGEWGEAVTRRMPEMPELPAMDDSDWYVVDRLLEPQFSGLADLYAEWLDQEVARFDELAARMRGLERAAGAQQQVDWAAVAPPGVPSALATMLAWAAEVPPAGPEYEDPDFERVREMYPPEELDRWSTALDPRDASSIADALAKVRGLIEVVDGAADEASLRLCEFVAEERRVDAFGPRIQRAARSIGRAKTICAASRPHLATAAAVLGRPDPDVFTDPRDEEFSNANVGSEYLDRARKGAWAAFGLLVARNHGVRWILDEALAGEATPTDVRVFVSSVPDVLGFVSAERAEEIRALYDRTADGPQGWAPPKASPVVELAMQWAHGSRLQMSASGHMWWPPERGIAAFDVDCLDIDYEHAIELVEHRYPGGMDQFAKDAQCPTCGEIYRAQPHFPRDSCKCESTITHAPEAVAVEEVGRLDPTPTVEAIAQIGQAIDQIDLSQVEEVTAALRASATLIAKVEHTGQAVLRSRAMPTPDGARGDVPRILNQLSRSIATMQGWSFILSSSRLDMNLRDVRWD